MTTKFIAWIGMICVCACAAAQQQENAKEPDGTRLQVQDRVTVTAWRAPIAGLDSAASTRSISSEELRQAPAVSLDGKLRQVPGLELFRRSSALVANPSSQGMSLRALGSTSASRTLVTEDDVPLNDAFAGWIHWLEQPALSLRSVEVVRGGASDLYGSSAIGGVVNLIPVRPEGNALEVQSSLGGLNTYEDNVLASGKRGPWGVLASAGMLGTDGYIQTAPAQRGAVDVPSNVNGRNALAMGEYARESLRVFARGSVFSEARNNGTPDQTNGTRLWRGIAGVDEGGVLGGTLTLRGYGSTMHYRQTFSSVNAARSSEMLNKFSLTPTDEMGAVARWSLPVRPGLLLIVGSDVHDVRAEDFELPFPSRIATHISDRQRQVGLYGEVLWTHRGWTASASAREDGFRNFDGVKWVSGVRAELAQRSEQVFDPRLGLARRLGMHWAVSGMGFRAYRAPTPNELYRATQVGNQLTLPNNDLESERATGWESGVTSEYRWGTARASWFWTAVNRPVVAETTNANSSPIMLVRANLGQIASKGVSLDYEVEPVRGVAVAGGYQYARATVTKGPVDVGNWIPEVARNMASMTVRGELRQWGSMSLEGHLAGRQYDNDTNTAMLHGYFRLDAYVGHDFGQRWEAYVTAENLLDRDIEIERAPTLELGQPRVFRGGFRLRVGAVR